MNINSCDQPEKAQKFGTASQSKDKANQAKHGSKAKKCSEKIKQEKKKKYHQGWCKKPSSIATKANTTPVTGGKGQKKKKKTWDAFKVPYYNCNKKGHFVSNYPEPKVNN